MEKVNKPTYLITLKTEVQYKYSFYVQSLKLLQSLVVIIWFLYVLVCQILALITRYDV